MLSLLALLINKSLVICEGEGASSRYRLLETIRHYGREKLAGQPALGQETDDGTTEVQLDPSPPEEALAPMLRREGEYWTVAVGGNVARLKHIKGLSYLHHLLSSPEREWHVLDLVTAVEGHGSEPPQRSELSATPAADALEVIDPEARAAYRRRLVDLQEDLDEAEAMGNRDRAGSIKEEMEALAEQLAGSTGLGSASSPHGATSCGLRLRDTSASSTRHRRPSPRRYPICFGCITVSTSPLRSRKRPRCGKLWESPPAPGRSLAPPRSYEVVSSIRCRR